MDTNHSQQIWMLIARKLSGEASVADLHELDQLLKLDPQINYSKELLHDIWANPVEVDSQYAENKYKELVMQIQNMGLDDGKFNQDNHFINQDPVLKSNYYKKWLYAVAWVVVFVALFGVLYFATTESVRKSEPELTSKNEIRTKNGSKTNLVLPDGTKVWLNASSELTYEKIYGNKIREVTLKGEAYFDVVKNSDKPFIIHTAKMDIKVLGTAFNVKCYPGEKTTETSLIRGSIEVTLKDRQEKIMMKPNEKLVISNEENEIFRTTNKRITPTNSQKLKPIISLGHLSILQKDSSVIETAWVQNRLIFISESFEDIALKMERWYGFKIEFAAESLKSIVITGAFEKESITEALTAMQLTTAFGYSIKNNVITILKNKSSRR